MTRSDWSNCSEKAATWGIKKASMQKEAPYRGDPKERLPTLLVILGSIKR
jgi:hypothetical protein